MKYDEKKCPDCAEAIKKDARVCRYCGHEFSAKALAEARQQEDRGRMIGVIAIVLLLLLVAVKCSGEDPVDPAAVKAEADAEAAKKAANRKAGFHCLGLDGSHSGLIQQLKSGLRDPDSFEHDETRITPVDEKGNHVLTMRYRARNGFGGMNVQTLIATVRNGDCGGRIVSTGDE